MEEVSWLKHRPLRGPSHPTAQAGKIASTFPFSTGNPSPARPHHSTCFSPTFIMLLSERHLISLKLSLFLLCHFQACRLQQKFSPWPLTLHHAFPRFISFSLFQPKCGKSSYNFLIFFSLILSFDVNWNRHQYLPIFNGNSLMNI